MNRTPSYLVHPGNLRVVFLAAFASFFILTGCLDKTGELGAGEATKVDRVATLLSGVTDTAFRSAFSGIDNYRYTRYTRTEQFDTDDFLVAFRENVYRADWEGGARQINVQQEDSAGTFDFGFFDRFTSSNMSGLDPVDLVQYLLPEDPPYLLGRNREKYEWRFLPDTLLWDTQAKVIEVKARRLKGDGENIRKVRHYVDRTTNELIAMYLERIDLALLFREESQFFVHMRRAADGQLVPHNTRFQTHIRTPFETDSKFRTVSTYYELEPIPDEDSTTVHVASDEDAAEAEGAVSSKTKDAARSET
ncbi:MAG: hypothetical protein ACI9W4_000921 [Rhodothermales bacterium]|jgi:hypothetical protein